MLRVACDVSERSSVEAMVQVVEAELGPVEILVNNAGIYPMQSFTSISLDDWNRVISTNLSSVFHTCQCIIPGMKRAGLGRVINITSNTFFMGLPNMAHYIASNGAVIGLICSLSSEFGRFGITANCVAPNFTRTEGTAIVEATTPEVVAQTVASQSIPRVAVPADVAGTILFLAGDAAAFMTGQTLVVDGGTIKH
jgi:3-oxoacyl-[acyl-carrier protein] reductase